MTFIGNSWKQDLEAQPQGEREAFDGLSAKLWCDLRTDEERSAWLLLGRGHETGVVAQALQNDLAMAYHRLALLSAEPVAHTAVKAVEFEASPSNQDEQAFAEWLNAQRNLNVSEVFHEIVDRYSAALSAATQPAAVPMSQKTQDGHSVSSVAEAPTTPAPSAQGPAELWIQLHGDTQETGLPVDYTGDDVTWCWHQIHDSDVRYVRADLAAAPQPAGTQKPVAKTDHIRRVPGGAAFLRVAAGTQSDQAGIRNVRDTLIRAGEKPDDAQRMAEEGWREMQRDAVQQEWLRCEFCHQLGCKNPAAPHPEAQAVQPTQDERNLAAARLLHLLKPGHGLPNDFRLVPRQPEAQALDSQLQQPDDVGGLEYRGNSVSFIHSKMTAYRSAIDEAWTAMRECGCPPDGKTRLADAIRALAQQDDHAGSPAPSPVATLHDDGHYTFKPGKEPWGARQAGWRMDVFASPSAVSAEAQAFPRGYKQLPEGYAEIDSYDFWKPIRDLPSEADESPQRIHDARNVLPTQKDAGQEPCDARPGKIR